MIIICTVLTLASCKGPISDEMAKEIVIPILERETELNTYIYGDAFKTKEDPKDDVNSPYSKYYEVDKNGKYTSIDALKKEISEIYSFETVEVVNIYAFNGYSDSADGGASITPRFAQSNEGVLQIDVTKDPYEMRGVIHTESIKVLRSTNKMMKIRVKYSRFSSEGKETVVEKDLILMNEEGIWKLNTQTFAVKCK